MGNAKFSDDFTRDALEQIVDRGYPVSEVSRRLGVSVHSLYGWVKKFGRGHSQNEDDQAAEIRRLKRELQRVTKERDILKKAATYFAKNAKWSTPSSQLIEITSEPE